MNKKYLGLLLVVIILLLVWTVVHGKSTVPTKQSNKKISVVASFYSIHFLASQIGADEADVYNVTPAGSEPHDYEPTSQDIARIEKSNMLIINGAKLEPWTEKIKDDLAGKNVTVVTLSNDLTTQQFTDEEGETVSDPHIWLSPKLAKLEAAKITEAFVEKDAKRKDFYQANYQKLAMKLDDLDTSYKQGLATCQQKNIITSHAAFGYLAQAYGLRQVPIAGLSPDAEPSSKELAQIAQFAKENNVKYIFFESLVSPKLSETLAKEVGAQTLVLNPIEGLSDDDRKADKNYFTVMQDNLRNLRIGLQCS